MIFRVLTVICAVAWNLPRAQAVADVTAPAGRVAGLELDVLGTTVNAFLGIPFAQPPVGAGRFRRAEPMETWDGIYNATRKPRACSQDGEVDTSEDSLYERYLTGPVSEDCLYLNVWQPNPAPTGAAVMVWIYGGVFQTGDSMVAMYDGRYLAATEGVILVNFNYRLSTLGFLYAGTDDAPGNVGLTDQVLALQWVQNNIASFGGDPAKVTLVGYSAGANSVGYHLLSPGSWNLFNRAILESGTALSPWGVDTKATAFANTVTFAEALGCPTEEGSAEMLACLRSKDAQKLVNTSLLGGIFFFPVQDGIFIPESPSFAYENKAFKKADILIGSVANEGIYFLLNLFPFLGFSMDTESIISREQFLQGIPFVHSTLTNEFAIDAVAFQYTDWLNLDKPTMYRDALESLLGDFHFHCPNVNTGRAHVREGATVYMYRFAHIPSVSPYPAWMGVTHGDEIQFVFGLPFNPAANFTAGEKLLSLRMMRHWANFAKTGNPNNNNETTWRPFNETVGVGGYMVLDTNEPRMLPGPSTVNCAFWDNYVKPLVNKTDALKKKAESVEPCETSGAKGDHNITVAGLYVSVCLLAILQIALEY